LRRDKRVERGTGASMSPAPTTPVFTSQSAPRAHVADHRSAQWPDSPMTPEAQSCPPPIATIVWHSCRRPDTCKNKSVACAGGKYDPTPLAAASEPPPRYNTVRINRHDGPEDGGLCRIAA